MKKHIYIAILASILLSACLFDSEDNSTNNTTPAKGTLHPAFVGDWLFTYKTSSEQELWQWIFNADGSMNSCRWETTADGSQSTSQSCVVGSWSDVGDVATLWPELYPRLEEYTEFPISKGHAILTPIDSSKSHIMRWNQGWLLYARNDTLTYLGVITVLYGGPQLYADPWTYQDQTLVFNEDGTCSMLKNDSSDCSWGIRENNEKQISWKDENGKNYYLEGHLAILDGILLFLDIEDPADFLRQ